VERRIRGEVVVRFSGSDGIRLVGDMAGPWDGPLVVLLHGGGQTRFAWGQTSSVLADRGFLALSLDARGHGESEWSADGTYSMDSFVADLCRVVEQLGKPAALVGASLGGLTSIIAAAERPAIDCTALVLVDVAPRVNEAGVDAIQEFMLAYTDGFATVEEAADAVAAYLPHRPRPRDTAGLRKNLRYRDDGRYYWHWDPRLLIGNRNGPRSVPPERFERALAGLSNPLLLVRGGQSEVVGEGEVAAFRKVAPEADYIDVPAAAHMVAGDQNDVFTAAVVSFLDRHLGDGPSNAPTQAELP
jgi:pimeloyl-ACP methyl ester carboxylesterase